MRLRWVVVGLLAACAWAAEDQAYLALEAETSAQKMAGMPAIQLPPGMTLPPGFALPPEVQAMMGGGATRKLNVRLWSPGLAPAGATATLAVPPGLKQGERLDLSLYRPKPGQTADDALREGMPPGAPKIEEMTIKFYWGSSRTVRPGQPKVIRIGDLPAAERQRMAAEARAAASKGSYFYRENWTTGYWPAERQPGTIAADASLRGTVALTTSYTGNVSLDVPAGVDFLAGYKLKGPDLSAKPDLGRSLDLAWEAIPDLLGQCALGMGMEGTNTIVLWSSSEVENYPDMAGFLEMAQVRAQVQAQRFMAPDRTTCSVPAGIFARCTMPMITLTGWGRGAARDGTQPLPRLQTKTSLQIMLGGPGGMGGMGGMPAMPAMPGE